MARRSSGGRSAPRAAPRRPVQNPPQPASRAPAPVPAQGQSGGMLAGIGSTIAQGVAFGAASSAGHRIMDAVVGPRTIQHEMVGAETPSASAPAMASNSCVNQSKAFEDCLSNYGSDISKCQFYLDMLSECRKNPTMSL